MYRLPTEAEWEFACRAGTTSHFNWGDTPSSLLANFNGQARTVFNPRNDVGPFLGRTEIVGAYPPNAFGLHDMHGNVAELCADLYLPSGYQMESTLDPQGASKSDQRVARGGGPGGSGMFARSAARMPLLLKAAAPDIHAQRDFEPGANLGFRLLLEIAVPK